MCVQYKVGLRGYNGALHLSDRQERPARHFKLGSGASRTIALRSGHGDFLQVPESEKTKGEVRVLSADLNILPQLFAGCNLLTPREIVVLGLIAKGLTSKEAGRALGISHRTVDFHRANIMEKTGARNTPELVRRVLGGA